MRTIAAVAALGFLVGFSAARAEAKGRADAPKAKTEAPAPDVPVVVLLPLDRCMTSARIEAMAGQKGYRLAALGETVTIQRKHFHDKDPMLIFSAFATFDGPEGALIVSHYRAPLVVWEIASGKIMEHFTISDRRWCGPNRVAVVLK